MCAIVAVAGGIGLDRAALALESGSTVIALLRAEVERRGEVRVLVTLAMPGTPPAPEVAIAAAQERLAAALTGSRYRDLYRFRHLPQVAVTVRSDALEVLIASTLVASLSQDSLAAPMEGTRSR